MNTSPATNTIPPEWSPTHSASRSCCSLLIFDQSGSKAIIRSYSNNSSRDLGKSTSKLSDSWLIVSTAADSIDCSQTSIDIPVWRNNMFRTNRYSRVGPPATTRTRVFRLTISMVFFRRLSSELISRMALAVRTVAINSTRPSTAGSRWNLTSAGIPSSKSVVCCVSIKIGSALGSSADRVHNSTSTVVPSSRPLP